MTRIKHLRPICVPPVPEIRTRRATSDWATVARFWTNITRAHPHVSRGSMPRLELSQELLTIAQSRMLVAHPLRPPNILSPPTCFAWGGIIVQGGMWHCDW